MVVASFEINLSTETRRHREDKEKMTNDFFGFLCVSLPLWLELPAMTETERSLLDAVLENPDDDLPRLVYADWLDENGDPKRAEFIRAQIALSLLENEDGYHTDEYRRAIFSIKNTSSASSFKQWIEYTGLKICHVNHIFHDMHCDSIRVRDMKSYNHYHFQRGFLTSIIAYEEWCFEHWNSITLLPLKRIDFQPHISKRAYFVISHENSNTWKVAYHTGPNNCDLTFNSEFSHRHDAFQWFTNPDEKQRIEHEIRTIQIRNRAILDLRHQIQTDPEWSTYRGPLDDITLGNLVDSMRRRPTGPAAGPGGPEYDGRE
jgi:uncharacterized protein (TIGR02996 family)